MASTSVRLSAVPCRRRAIVRRTTVILTVFIMIAGGVSTPPAGAALTRHDTVRTGERPQPLPANVPPASAPAADGQFSTGSSSPPSARVREQLDAGRKAATDGKPRDARHVQITDEARTPYDTVYLNADGSKTLERSVQATNYQEQGRWKRVDVGLEQDRTSGVWQTKHNSWTATFGDSKDQGVGLAAGGQSLTFKPLGGATVVPHVTGQAPNQIVTYGDVWPGVDLLYQVTGSEVKESIVLKNRKAAVRGQPLHHRTPKLDRQRRQRVAVHRLEAGPGLEPRVRAFRIKGHRHRSLTTFYSV